MTHTVRERSKSVAQSADIILRKKLRVNYISAVSPVDMKGGIVEQSVLPSK